MRGLPTVSARIGWTIGDVLREGTVLDLGRPSLPETPARTLPRLSHDAGDQIAAAPRFS